MRTISVTLVSSWSVEILILKPFFHFIFIIKPKYYEFNILASEFAFSSLKFCE